MHQDLIDAQVLLGRTADIVSGREVDRKGGSGHAVALKIGKRTIYLQLCLNKVHVEVLTAFLAALLWYVIMVKVIRLSVRWLAAGYILYYRFFYC